MITVIITFLICIPSFRFSVKSVLPFNRGNEAVFFGIIRPYGRGMQVKPAAEPVEEKKGAILSNAPLAASDQGDLLSDAELDPAVLGAAFRGVSDQNGVKAELVTVTILFQLLFSSCPQQAPSVFNPLETIVKRLWKRPG
ncbi:MAG: hypothetical protein U5R30_14515 [Deltaproteobacteria bacterium]|nr:hypothetical protein [Deltaproteobacteria bacterium]